MRSPWVFTSLGQIVPDLSAFPHRRDAPDPSSSLWAFTGLFPVCPCFSCTGEPSSGHSPPAVASPVLSRGEGSPPSTCSIWAQTLRKTSEKHFLKNKTQQTTKIQSNNRFLGVSFLFHTHGGKQRTWMRDLQFFQAIVQAISSIMRALWCLSEQVSVETTCFWKLEICPAEFMLCPLPLLQGMQGFKYALKALTAV